MLSNTIVVWVLVLWTGNGNVAIDNIATRADCQRALATYAQVSHGLPTGHCIPVRKVAP